MDVIRPQQPAVSQGPQSAPNVARAAQPDVSSQELASVDSNIQQPEPAAQSAEDLQAVVRDISEFVQSYERKIQFQVSEASGRTIIQVYDKVTDELIREIPSEEVQRISQAIRDELESGLLVKLEV